MDDVTEARLDYLTAKVLELERRLKITDVAVASIMRGEVSDLEMEIVKAKRERDAARQRKYRAKQKETGE